MQGWKEPRTSKWGSTFARMSTSMRVQVVVHVPSVSCLHVLQVQVCMHSSRVADIPCLTVLPSKGHCEWGIQP